MYYEINVTIHGKHLFATAPRSITSPSQAKTTFELVCKKFPPEEGFGVTCTRYELTGERIQFADEAS